MTANKNGKIAFQGWPGANSDMACRDVYPHLETLPCPTFGDAFAAVRDGAADLAMIPIDNSVAGRVADIHHLLPDSGLYITAEYFLRVRHYLLGVKGSSLTDITHVHSHIHALNQCRNLIKNLGLEPVVHADTAGAAADIARAADKTQAAIASPLAAKIDGLSTLKENVEDAEHNTTRFVIMAREPVVVGPETPDLMTSFVFRVRNMPAALYKAMGGFATNGVNMTKLESYVRSDFVAAQFYADVEGHPEQENLKHAFEELEFFSHEVKILGTYPRHNFRRVMAADDL